jgi:hypothetical protein
MALWLVFGEDRKAVLSRADIILPIFLGLAMAIDISSDFGEDCAETQLVRLE